MVSFQPTSKPVLSSYHSFSHWSSTDGWSCVKSPPASNAPSSSLYPKTKNHRTEWLQTYCFNVCGDEVIWKACVGPPEGHYWNLAGPLQFSYRANRSVDDAVNMGLHYILQHLDKPGTYARILFVDFSSAFNTIFTLQNQLTRLYVPTSICQWITSFLTDRQQL